MTHSHLTSQHELGKVSDKLAQQIKNIENIRQDLIETKEHFNQKLKCAEDITVIREEIKKSQEELN